MATRQEIIGLLAYKMDPTHTIEEHIGFIYSWMLRLWISNIYEFYIEQQMYIVLNSLPMEYESIRHGLIQRLRTLNFNNLAYQMLLERERQYIAMGIRRTGRSARRLSPAARFVPWFEIIDFSDSESDDPDDIINDPDYVSSRV